MLSKKNIIITGVIIIIITVISSVLLLKSNKKIEYTTQSVLRGNLIQTMEATGKIESANQIELNFKRSGRISQILVDIGDNIVAGQVLARLEARDLQSQVTDAQARLDRERADYNKLISGASSEDIQVEKDAVSQKEQDLASAKNTLSNLLVKQDVEISNLKEVAITTLDNEIITAQNALEEVDKTLNNEDASKTLSVQNISYLNIAKRDQINSQDSINEVSIIVSSLNLSSSDAEVKNALEKGKGMLNRILISLSSITDVLSATITSGDLTQTGLDTLKTNIQNRQIAINTSKNNLQTAKSEWTNKIAYYQDQIVMAEDNIKEAESALQVANSQLILKESPPRDFEIAAQEALIKQAQASLGLALANLDETIIKAPLNGTLTKKNFNVGEQSSLSTPVLEIIGESTLQIEVDVPESDIANIKVGQLAEITLDAFSDEEVFLGTVSFIDPAETIIQDVVYYKIKVQLDEQYDKIKPGMTANVKIVTAEKENILFVPFRAVKTKNGDKYVDVLINNMPEQKIVEVGLRGDEGIEILSGVEEGKDVVTFVKEQ